MNITPLRPYFHEQDIKFIIEEFQKILEGQNFLTMGQFGEQFEQEFAEYHEKKYAISCNSGTSALEIICRGLDLEGHEVILPTNTFIASANAILGAGGIPVFADIGKDMTIDPLSVKSLINERTKAIMTVHIGGYVSPNTYELLDICEEHNILLLEDAAQAHGSMLDGKKAGTFGIAGAFSFFPTKVLTTGEGGMVITDDQNLYQKGLSLRQFGKTQEGIYQNYSKILGYNWRMTEVSALMGITQLKRIEQFISRRTEISKIYDEELATLHSIEKLSMSKEVRHNWYKYIVFLKEHNREDVHLKLKQKYAIDLSGYVYEIPLHKQPALQKYVRSSLPNSEDFCARHICLPLFYSLTDDDTRYIAASLKEVLQ
tara:strand:- start:1282 stop:2397 length:1116 start_codon:yes stop_codon:yes gene_type:complete